MVTLRWALAAYGFLFACCPIVSTAETPLERLRIMALAPYEERAVVQTPEGDLHVVQHGDLLPGTAARVLQILPDKLVVEEPTGSTPERGKHLTWIYKRPPLEGDSRVQRLRRDPPDAVPVLNTAPPPFQRPQR